MTTPSIYCVFICTNPNQTSILGSGGNLQLPREKKILIEKLGIRVQSASLQWQEHFKWQNSGMLVFHMTNLKQTLFKPQIYGAGPCQQVRQYFKESSINIFFSRGNCRFPPLPRIEV